MGGRKIVQSPGKKYCFPCGHAGIFPELGFNNDFVRWRKHSRPHSHGGYWVCKVCGYNYRHGTGLTGMSGWAKSLISTSRKEAQLDGYQMAKITPEELAVLRKNAAYCADGCGQKLKWCTDGSFRNPHLHHNHKTGEVYGFVTKYCNSAQGLFSRIGNGNMELQVKWLEYHFPHITEYIAEYKI
jgi:hypothetical protein